MTEVTWPNGRGQKVEHVICLEGREGEDVGGAQGKTEVLHLQYLYDGGRLRCQDVG